MRKIHLLAALTALSLTALSTPALAQSVAPSPSYAMGISGEVRPTVRFDYVPTSDTSGTLTVQVCNTPACQVIVEPTSSTDQPVMVSVDNGAPIQINGPTVVVDNGPMLNESHTLSVSGGTIGVRVDGH